jgi:hypothetical protein
MSSPLAIAPGMAAKDSKRKNTQRTTKHVNEDRYDDQRPDKSQIEPTPKWTAQPVLFAMICVHLRRNFFRPFKDWPGRSRHGADQHFAAVRGRMAKSLIA